MLASYINAQMTVHAACQHDRNTQQAGQLLATLKTAQSRKKSFVRCSTVQT